MEKLELSDIQSLPNISLKKKSILIIDDSDYLLEAQSTILEMEDFEVFTSLSGTEALNVLAKIDPPDLIILDVQMGDMSGPEFLDLLEEKMPIITNNVPVVFLTGMNNVPPAKVVGLIKKPFDIETYLEAVHRFIKIERPFNLKQ